MNNLTMGEIYVKLSRHASVLVCSDDHKGFV